jgi:hypothetical protein
MGSHLGAGGSKTFDGLEVGEALDSIEILEFHPEPD